MPAPDPRPAVTAAPRSAARTRVVVALSGGVDSAVTALLLREQGFEVQGLFMKNWEEDDGDGYCAAARDLRDAEAVCERLDISLRTVNFSCEYWDQVFTRTLREYAAGRTPNPDVLCNREIKFDVFLDFALSLGAQRLATGHYARIAVDGGRRRLLKGSDPAKDQSYFLHAVGQAALARVQFPLGAMRKQEVRRIARRAGLANHDKKDSTGICFIGERPFREFLQRFLPPEPGPIESPCGERLGEHPGLMYYTLGQREGLGIGGRRGGSGAPWYVVARDRARNALIVAQGRDDPRLLSRALLAAELRWVAGAPPALPMRAAARIRYRQPDQACVVREAGPGRIRVEFDTPQWAATAGQSVVLYAGEECLGGGVIEATEAPRDGR